VKLFQALQTSNLRELRDLAPIFVRENQPERLIIALDFYLHDFSHMQTSGSEAALDLLKLFLVYARAVYPALAAAPSLKSPWLQKLLGFQAESKAESPSGQNMVLQACTPLWDAYQHELSGPSENAPLTVSWDDLATVVTSLLSRHLNAVITKELCVSKRLAALFEPCATMALRGSCRIQHTKAVSHETNEAGYHNRVHFHLLQIELLHINQKLPWSGNFRSRMRERRYAVPGIHTSLSAY